ncbi:MAG: hypothetical protein ABSF99_09055 [Anaerolineales bacterium]|jgi:hypothetical protein
MKQTIEIKKINLCFLGTANGIILILLGVTALLIHRLEIDAYLVLLASLGLLATGSAYKKTALIILGCLLSGAGLGLLMYAGPWNILAENQKGLFMLCIALGWLLIPLFTRLFAAKTYWLAFIPSLVALILAGALPATNDMLPSWIMQSFLLNRSLSALITSADLVLIGFVLMIPWPRKGSLGHLDHHHIRN